MQRQSGKPDPSDYNKNMLMEGIFAAVPTPFYPDERVYLRKLEANVAHYSRTLLSGLLLLGSTGEAVMLDDAESREVLRVAAAAAAAFAAWPGTCPAPLSAPALESRSCLPASPCGDAGRFVDPTACGGGEATGRATVVPGAAGACRASALSSCGGRGEAVGSVVASLK